VQPFADRPTIPSSLPFCQKLTSFSQGTHRPSQKQAACAAFKRFRRLYPQDAQRDAYLTKLPSQADSMFELFAGEDLKCLCFMEACERRKTCSSQFLMSENSLRIP
jgi:hypothetical protein